MLAGEVLNGPARRIETMARKSAIGANSHDAAVRTRTGGTKRAEPAKAVKERVTFQLPVGLIEKARDVVGEIHGRGARCSVEAGGEEARRAVFRRATAPHSRPEGQ